MLYFMQPVFKTSFYMDETLQNTKNEIENHISGLKRKYGQQVMSFPLVTYGYQGGQYTVDFLIDQRKCDIFSLLVQASSLLEQEEKKKKKSAAKPFENIRTMGKGNNMTFVLEFTEEGKNRISKKGSITFMGEFRADRPSFRFCLTKAEEVTETDIQIIKTIYETANKNTLFSTERMKNVQNASITQRRQSKDQQTQEGRSLLKKAFGGDEEEKEYQEAVEKLREMGIVIFSPDDKREMQNLTWSMLAGYEKQKRDIEDTVLMSLTHPEIYDEISQGTRMRFEENRAKAVLFEGPPGTGKTTSAKIIASQVGIPLLYMPLESIMSKWYGDAEKRLADVFEGASKLGRSIVFIDEIDAIASGRDG